MTIIIRAPIATRVQIQPPPAAKAIELVASIPDADDDDANDEDETEAKRRRTM